MTSFSSYNGYKLNLQLTYSHGGFIAQSVEHRAGIAVMGSNPVGASEFFLGFICNCLSYFTTVNISFSVIVVVVVIIIIIVAAVAVIHCISCILMQVEMLKKCS